MVNLLDIGYSKKPYGKDGFLRLNIKEEFIDSLMQARAVFIDLDGSRVPFLIQSIDNKSDIIIKLDEIDNPQDASQLVNKALFLDDREVSMDTNKKAILQKDSLINFELYDQNNIYCGQIIETEEYPFQLMAHVLKDDQTVLVPLHEDWILKIDTDQNQIHMDLPEGLI